MYELYLITVKKNHHEYKVSGRLLDEFVLGNN